MLNRIFIVVLLMAGMAAFILWTPGNAGMGPNICTDAEATIHDLQTQRDIISVQRNQALDTTVVLNARVIALQAEIKQLQAQKK